jgi:hypothetical protein
MKAERQHERLNSVVARCKGYIECSQLRFIEAKEICSTLTRRTLVEPGNAVCD